MKFLKKEFNSLREIIKSNGQDPDDFHHVKKRGHLYVHKDAREDTFCFFRKKETKLVEGQFVDSVTYFLDPRNKIAVESWDEVLAAFERWLKA